jgi:chromate reductase, NAD(P)H dehydrogenase (quinone)
MPSSDRAPIAIAGIVASLRRHSFNGALMEAARQRMPAGLDLSIVEALGEIPMFNEDLEEGGGPADVKRLLKTVARADALLIATPEYNQSIPGVTKNLIDWLSRADPSVLEGKPVAIMGATSGPWGTRLAQAALRHTLTACGALVMPQPQLYVRHAGEVFAADGGLLDARIASQLEMLLTEFAQWISITNPSVRERTP